MINVLFVCLGNICRSPTAHGIFQHLVNEASLNDRIYIDSAGTGDWNIGRSPDRRSAAAALQRGYDLSDLIARQVNVQDFEKFNYVLAMDRQNLQDLQAMKPANFQGHLDLFLKFAPSFQLDEVPDPYYGDADGFQTVLDMVEEACRGLLQHIRQHHL